MTTDLSKLSIRVPPIHPIPFKTTRSQQNNSVNEKCESLFTICIKKLSDEHLQTLRSNSELQPKLLAALELESEFRRARQEFDGNSFVRRLFQSHGFEIAGHAALMLNQDHVIFNQIILPLCAKKPFILKEVLPYARQFSNNKYFIGVAYCRILMAYVATKNFDVAKARLLVDEMPSQQEEARALIERAASERTVKF